MAKAKKVKKPQTKWASRNKVLKAWRCKYLNIQSGVELLNRPNFPGLLLLKEQEDLILGFSILPFIHPCHPFSNKQFARFKSGLFSFPGYDSLIVL
jgi:hypothetical protein